MRWPLLLAPLLVAAAPAEVLTIGGAPFPQAEITDARAVGTETGPAIYVTLNPAAAARFAALTKASLGKPLNFALGGRLLSSPVIVEPVLGGSFQIVPALKDFTEAEALALRISGKAPLPEDLEE